MANTLTGEGSGMPKDNRFIPPRFLRGAYTQTILASSRVRAFGGNPMKEAAREMICDAGGGIRLQGFISRQSSRVPSGLIILLHDVGHCRFLLHAALAGISTTWL